MEWAAVRRRHRQARSSGSWARRYGWGGGDSYASQVHANLQLEQLGERVLRFAAENEAEWRAPASADEGGPTDPGSTGLASPGVLTNPLNANVFGSIADFWVGAETAFGSWGETAPASAPAGLGGGDPASGPSAGANAQSTRPIPTATGTQPGVADPLAGPATTGLLPGVLTAFGTGATLGTSLDTHGASSLLGAGPLMRPSSQGPRIRPNSGGGGGGSLVISVANLSAQEGVALANVTVATFTESPMDALSHYSATIQWGDGNNSSGTISSGNGFDYVKGGHTYAEEGSYTVTVTVSDTDGSHASGNGIAGVSDAPLSGSADNVDATEGTAFSGTVASFTDADPQGAAGDYTATISWGDGTASSTGTVGTNNGAFDVSGSHTYLEEGSFTISVTVGDISGSTVVLTSTATVDDAPLSGTGLDITATAGSPAEVFVATFNDTDPNGTIGDYSAQIDWGDGTNSAGIVINIGTRYAVFGSHVYATQGSYGVSVDIADVGGSTVTTSSTATVAGMAALGTDIDAVEGEDTGTVTVATFTDADGSDASSFTALIDWGDGSTPTNGTVTGAGSFAVTGNHTYADAGTYSVTVTIQDTDGADATTEVTATVADAVLSSTGTTVTATEGTPLNDVPLAAFTDANTADASFDYTVDIYWGDGTPDSTGTVSGSDGSFVAGGTHTYADPGTYAVSIIIADEGGDSTCAVTTVTVNEAPLSGTGESVTVDQGASTAGLTLATFTDGNPTDDPSDYTVSIDWGDGSSEDSGTVTGSDGAYNVGGDHAYSAEGTYSVTITIADEGSPDTGDDGPTITVTSTVTVPDAPLSGENGPGVTTEGLSTGTVTLGSFTDADPDADISYYTATVDWGDGQTSARTISTADGITYVVTGSHTYTDVTGSPFTATTTVHDEGGSSTAFTAPVTLELADLDGKCAIAGAGWASEAQDDSPGILVGNSTANGAQLWVHATGLSGYTRTLSWDASRVTIYDGGTALAGSSVQLSESDGDKIYTVVATSGFGLSDTTVATLTVNAPGGGTESSDTVTMLRLADGQDVSAVEGASTGTVAVAAFSDPNAGDPASDYTATIDRGGRVADRHRHGDRRLGQLCR